MGDNYVFVQDTLRSWDVIEVMSASSQLTCTANETHALCGPLTPSELFRSR